MTLAVIALAGSIGLTRFAYHVATPASEGNSGITIRRELISVWIHPALFDLAQHPEDAEGCRTLRGFQGYADQRGLQKAWYVITAKCFLVNGETIELSFVRRPYEMLEPHYGEFVDILAKCAGKPSPYSVNDLSGAKVGIVPSEFLIDNPRLILDELRLREHLTVQDEGP